MEITNIGGVITGCSILIFVFIVIGIGAIKEIKEEDKC